MSIELNEVLGIECGCFSTKETDAGILLSVNNHDLVVLEEEEFIDLCQCCAILGQKLLQRQEIAAKKKLVEKMKNYT